jgi:hypothetical protein
MIISASLLFVVEEHSDIDIGTTSEITNGCEQEPVEWSIFGDNNDPIGGWVQNNC